MPFIVPVPVASPQPLTVAGSVGFGRFPAPGALERVSGGIVAETDEAVAEEAVELKLLANIVEDVGRNTPVYDEVEFDGGAQGFDVAEQQGNGVYVGRGVLWKAPV